MAKKREAESKTGTSERASVPRAEARSAGRRTAENRTRLIQAAAAAREGAVAPYSGFKVGAALLTRSGVIITGANVESASYGLTCCAERVALFKALTEGERDFVAVAVVARARGGAMPCGACRQLLAEYARSATVWVAASECSEKVKTYSVKRLLPAAFTNVPGVFSD